MSPEPNAASVSTNGAPAVLPMRRLHALWFQVTGLLCNLQCTHCLVDSSPGNDSLEFLDPGTVRRALAEAESLGVKEVYFTGGEPFLHRQLLTMLADALAVAPTTVLTNGTLVTERLAAGLAELAGRARYSLEIRVSLDHPDPARNDSVRGAGAHFKALRAVVRLDRAGLAPIVTATEYLLAPRRAGEGGSTYDAFLACLGEAGIRRPRLKILPVFHTGKLEDPTRGGAITEAMLRGIDASSLQCSESRVVAADGVYACPILVGKPSARIAPGTALTGGLGPVELAHHACRTCYETGMTCGNY